MILLHLCKHNFKARTSIVGGKLHFYVDASILLCHKKFNLNSIPFKTKELSSCRRLLANINSIQVNAKELMRAHSGCHGNLVAVEMK